MADDIVSRLILRGDQYFKTIKEAGQKTEKFSKDSQHSMTGLNNSIQTVIRAAKALAAAWAIREMVRMVNETARLSDELAKMSRRTGFTVETLNGLTQAAEKSAVGQEQLEVGLRQLNKNLLDFTRGTGEARKSFEALGITGEQAAGLLKTPEEAFLTIADRLSKIRDVGVRGAEAMRIFGESGTKLLPLLNQGRDAIAGQIEELQKLRPITTEQALAAEQYNDAITDLGHAFEGFLHKGVGPVLPVLTKFLEVLTDLVSLDMKDFKDNLRAILGGDFNDADRLETLKKQKDIMTSMIQEMEASLKSGGDKAFFGLLPTGLEDKIRLQRENLAKINEEISSIESKLLSEQKKDESTASLPTVVVAEKKKSSELASLIALNEARIKMVEAEEADLEVKSDRILILQEEIALLQEALAVQKEREAANTKGKEREIDPRVAETAAIEREARLKEIQTQRKKIEEELLGNIQELKGAEIVHEASVKAKIPHRQALAQLAEDEWKAQQVLLDAGNDDSKIRAGQILLAEARVHFLKKENELFGETTARRHEIRDLELEINRIREKGAGILQESLGRGIAKESSAEFEGKIRERLKPFQDAVREAQTQVDIGEILPGQLDETNRLRRIELIKATIALLSQERALNQLSADEFSEQFLRLDAQLRAETYETQRGFFEGWQDTFRKFTEDMEGAFGLGQTLARQFVTSVQNIAAGITQNIFQKLEEGTLSWRSALETLPKLLQQITSQLIGMAIAQGVASAIGGGLSGLFGGGGGTQGIVNAQARGAANPSLFGPGFASGGRFIVGGPAGTDRVPVRFWATRGEEVEIKTKEQQGNSGRSPIFIYNNSSSNVSVDEAPDGSALRLFIDQHNSASVRRGKLGRDISQRFRMPLGGRVG